MPTDKITYYNRIDIGIFLLFPETCLVHEKISFQRALFDENTDDSVEKVIVAQYKLL